MKDGSKWYIDSLDPRAGIAFATLRKPELASESSPLEEGETAYIAPPFFQPEFVGSRAPAFALGRAHGQIGLFVRDKNETQELPFSSLDAVAEFVRRVYLRGGSSDGPGGGGEEGEPTPPPDGGPAPEGDGPLQRIVGLAELMERRASSLPVSESINLDSLRGPFENVNWKDTIEQLLYAVQILWSAAKRLHGLQRVWAEHSLACMVTRLGLWEVLERPILSPIPFHFRVPDQSFRAWIEDRQWPYGRYGVWQNHGTDAYEDLSRIPVPDIISATGERFQTIQSVLNLVTSTPTDLFTMGKNQNFIRASFALMASAYLNLGQHSLPSRYTSPGEALELLGYQIQRGFDWLAGNLPRVVYAKSVEDLIPKASTIDRK